MSDKINIETCEEFKNFEEMKEIIDDYGDNVILHRTKMFQIFNNFTVNNLKKFREELYDLNNLKRPTDIIIFTDGFSFGASSFFIKGLQESGGAIIVGYKGNPVSDEIFDASQSASSYTNFENNEVYKNLLENGFKISHVSFYQSFDYSYQGNKTIPKEYNIFPVDERVNIYQRYNDYLYDTFIQKALEIFEKYNINKKCNPNNLLLTLDPNDEKTCYIFNNDKHAHGGYKYKENGEWSNNCIPYYCDIGYIFDTYKNICIKDTCVEEEEEKEGIIDSNSEDGFPAYAIVLISVSGAFTLSLVGVLLYKFVFSKSIVKAFSESNVPFEHKNKEADIALAAQN